MPKYKVSVECYEAEYKKYRTYVVGAENKDAVNDVLFKVLACDLPGFVPVYDSTEQCYWYHDGQFSCSIRDVSETHGIKDNFTEEELLYLLETICVIDKAFGLTLQNIIRFTDASNEVIDPLIKKLREFMNKEVKACG